LGTNNRVHVKKGDTVAVLAGKDKGKQGKVTRVLPKADKVIVEGVNLVKKHLKAGPKVRQAGIVSQEAPLHSSNVMLICSKCGVPSRVGFTVTDGRKARVCRKCGEIADKV
jgi:large subunit ribosomal protein L24